MFLIPAPANDDTCVVCVGCQILQMAQDKGMPLSAPLPCAYSHTVCLALSVSTQTEAVKDSRNHVHSQQLQQPAMGQHWKPQSLL